MSNPTDTLKIRKAEISDTSAIVGFQQKMAWETEQMTLIDEIITGGVTAVFRNPTLGEYWIAEDGSKVVASLLITYEWSDWRNANIWWFQSVYVLPEYRRKGVFRSMYQAVKDEAELMGVKGLRLYVETNNSRAQKTYEALGMNNGHYTMYEWLKE